MERPVRKQTRLQDYDYSAPGAYFVTICTQDRKSVLSEISVGAGVLDGPLLHLTQYGEMAEETIQGIDSTYEYLSVDKYVIMPNHVHLLITVSEGGPSRTPAPTNATIPRMVSTFKRFVNRKAGTQLWQRGYHEHVIRNEADYKEIWSYIDGNPSKWAEDRYYQT